MSQKHYRNKTQLAEDLIIYQRDDSTSGRWYVRARFGGTYSVRSLKTKDKMEATQRAYDFFFSSKELFQRDGEVKRTPILTWDDLVKAFVADREATTGTRSTWLLALEAANKKYFSPFFSEVPLKALPTSSFSNYWDYLRSKGKFHRGLPSSGTVRNQKNALAAIIQFGVSIGVLDRKLHKALRRSKPTWFKGKEDSVVGKRGVWSRTQYEQMKALLIKDVAEAKQPTKRLARLRLLVALKIMRNTGVRVSELLKIRFADFALLDVKGLNSVFVMTVRPEVSKVGIFRQVPALCHGSSLMKDLKQLQKLAGAEDYDLAFHSLPRTFMFFRRRHNLQFRDKQDRALSLGSIRHLYATEMLFQRDASPSLVARAMGSSISQLNNHYLSSDVLSQVESLVSASVLKKMKAGQD